MTKKSQRFTDLLNEKEEDDQDHVDHVWQQTSFTLKKRNGFSDFHHLGAAFEVATSAAGAYTFEIKLQDIGRRIS